MGSGDRPLATGSHERFGRQNVLAVRRSLEVILWSTLTPKLLLLVVLLLLPFVWLISIPFRILGIVVGAMLAFIRALFFLPARVLGGRRF